MAERLISIPPDLSQNLSVQADLDGVTYSLAFEWNSRARQWHVSLYNEDETVPIKLGELLEIGNPLFADKLPGYIEPRSATPLTGTMADLTAIDLVYVDAVSFAAAVPT